ncbi:MAG TPA: ABC transporter permease [Bryobacteraceae bacterium]|jgi:putative ABC transport system permease protein|nr:ABC transporter permease [Bryobacteraceae bacterium]
MTRDLLGALRFFGKHPLFTLAVTAILGLGIGANTAAFSLVDAVLLRPLPYKSGERLVRIEEVNPKLVIKTIAPEDYRFWGNRGDVFDKTAPYLKDVVTITGVGEPEQVFGERTSAQVFSLLGVPARLGRSLVDSDDVPGAGNVVVLSDRLWRRLFHANPGIIGRSITASDEVYTIVGVMPVEFEFPASNIDMWIPLRLTAGFTGWLEVVARMKPGVSLAQAQSAMEIAARQLEQQNRKQKAGLRIVLSPWRETLDRQYQLSLVFILAAVGLVLLIACANVGSLLLSRAVQRQKEIAIRAALGADFWRILRQLLTESLVLAVAGGLAGIAIARYAVQFLLKQLVALPIVLPHMQRVALNGRVLLVNMGLCVLVACLSSLAPVLLARKIDLQDVLRRGFGGGSRGSTRLFSILIASEAAFAFLLLVGSGLLLRSLIRLERADNGFRTEHVLTLRVPIGTRMRPRPTGKYQDMARQIEFYRDVLERFERIPDVKAAAVVNNLPLSGSSTSTVYKDADGSIFPVMTRTISPNYFAVMGTPLIRGRVFTEADHADSPRVAIINEYLAHHLFPGRDPVGQFLPDEEGSNEVAVVGVVKNSWQLSYNEPAKGEVFIPYRQYMFGTFLAAIVVRTEGEPLALADTLRKQVWAVDASEPVTKVETLADVIADSIWRPRFSAWIFSVLGGLALLLTSVGIYGVVAYTSSLRVREIGIRVALGASPGRVIMTVLRDAMLPLGAGLAISLIAALLLTRVLASLLYEVSGADPITYVCAGALLLGIGIVASIRPAWRAATADGIVYLRGE